MRSVMQSVQGLIAAEWASGRLADALTAAGAVFLVHEWAFGVQTVSDNAMEDTLRTSNFFLADRCLVDRLTPMFEVTRIERGDIVEFKCASAFPRVQTKSAARL